jgi:hypothetical protein
LALLIQQIQNPPVSKVGVLGLDAFFPSKERFAFAMKLNNLLAAPGFATWLEGEALDIDQMLHTSSGKPRLSIFSIAHLTDAERMFFVTLLLTQMVGWMRSQSGTTSLRALLYMDEIFGYFPPVSNPPSKLPLLTLLKQARAFGVGVVLATQNPVDLDYKGLANTGTWFIGRLQTERDKARVLEGLEGASAGAGHRFDRQRMEQTLAGLGTRIFLMNNVHEDQPVVFETRWCLSYLRGPLTRAQIKTLMASRKGTEAKTDVRVPGAEATLSDTDRTPSRPSPRASGLNVRPALPPEISQHFIPIRSTQPAGSTLLYQPMLLGAGQVRFTDAKAGVDATHDVMALTAITNGAIAVNWDDMAVIDVPLADLKATPQPSAQFGELFPAANKAKNYETWRKDFSNWLYRSQKLNILKSPSLNQTARPGESERDFRVRLQQGGREQRDQDTDRLRKTYASKIAALQERIRRAEQVKEREAEQAKAAYVQTAISVGATLLGAFLGRKTISASTIGKATTAARGVGRSMKESQDAVRAGETIDALKAQLQDLEGEFRREVEALAAKMDPLTERFDTITMKPNKSNITVKLVTLAWVPHWKDQSGNLTPAWQ